MDWNSLLNEDRRRKSNKNQNDLRNEFERDYDRIVYCSAFRRLQDKAQVFPLEESDYVRTRLTHSLEVSTLGRSFGVDVARKLQKENMLEKNYDIEFGSILLASCLVHDIGNPPFGHFGETIIRNWFTEYLVKDRGLKEEEKLDFLRFEGNAQAFRILTRLQFLRDPYGLNLTYGTLATLMKYPRASNEVCEQRGSSYKKNGYFQSERDIFLEVKEKTGIQDARHPLAFLLEAADDIAYSGADVEDGFKKGVISWEILISILDDKLKDQEQFKGLVSKLIQERDNLKEQGFPEPELHAIQFFRTNVQGLLFRACVDTFISNYHQILEGTFDKSLISQSQAYQLCKVLKNIGFEYIYNSKKVLTLEVVGYKVIKGLLDMFVDAMMSGNYENKKTLSGKLYSLISPNFRYVFKYWTQQNTYNKLQLVTDFISGMTDNYAVELYQKLSGVKLI